MHTFDISIFESGIFSSIMLSRNDPEWTAGMNRRNGPERTEMNPKDPEWAGINRIEQKWAILKRTEPDWIGMK